MNNIVEGLKNHYKHLHPLLFARSQEKAKSENELFDILDDFPKEYPVIWDDELRRWLCTDDLLQSRSSEMQPGNEL